MARALQAKRHTLQTWSDGTKATFPPAPVLGGAPTLTLTPGATSMGLSIAASPPTGRTVIDWQVQRLIAGIWTDVTLPGFTRPNRTPARRTSTPTKYVHPSGTLGGNSAYTSFAAAKAAAVPGDVIVFGGTFSERVVWDVSGTSGAPIELRKYDEGTAWVVDGTGVTVSWNGGLGSGSLFSIQAQHVILDGVEIRDSDGHGLQIGDCANNGFFIANSSTWYQGIKIYRTKIAECVGVGLVTLMTDGAEFMGGDISACQKGTYWDTSAGNPVGWAYAVLLAGRNGKFSYNKCRQTMGEGVHLGHHIQYLSGPARALNLKGFELIGNTFYDCWSAPVYFTVCEDGLVEENLVFFTDDPRFWWARSTSSGYPQVCFAFGCELGAYGNPSVGFDATYPGVQNIVIRNNIGNGANRIFLIASHGAVGRYRNVDIDHNTLFGPRGAFPSVYEVISNEGTVADDDLSGFRWRNNKLLANDPSDISITWNALGAGKVVQGNLFSHTPPSDLSSASNIIDSGSTVLADKTYLVSGTTWPSEATFDLTKAAPYYVGSTVSPAVNAVASIGVTHDFYGNERPSHTGLADVGAISLSVANERSHTVTGLANDTLYEFRARYRGDDATWSDYCAPVSATTGAGGGGASAPTFDQIAQSSTNLSGTSAGAKNWTPDLAGVDAGDVVLVHAIHMNNDTGGNFPAMLAPAGYHLLGSDESDASDWSKAWWWFHIWEAGDVDPTFTADNSQASYRITGQAAVYKSNAAGINKIDHTVASSGTSTGGSGTTLQNSGAAWTPGQWVNHLLYLPASGRYAMVASNTATQLTLRTDIGITIGSGLSYEIRALKFAKQRNAVSSTSVTAPGLTPAQQPCRLVSMFLASDGNTNIGTASIAAPGGMTKRGEVKDNNNWTIAAMADEVRTSLSATGSRVASFGSLSCESWGASIVIRGG